MNETAITFKYIFDEDYNPVYVNGAQGGINPQGEIIANFYLERLALPTVQVTNILPDGKLGDTVSTRPVDLNNSFVRVVKNGVVMNLQTAKTIHEWLGKNIENLEQIIANKANIN